MVNGISRRFQRISMGATRPIGPMGLSRKCPSFFSAATSPIPQSISTLFPLVLERLRPSQGWLSRLSAEIFLAQQLGVSRIQIYLDADLPLAPAQLQNFEEKLAQIADGYSPAILSGRVRFFNTVFEVEKSVFIPRPETENLVEVLKEVVLQRCGTADAPTPLRMLDLCTGAGNIPIALIRALPSFVLLEINATDICPNAVALAEKNTRNAGYESSINIFQGDLFGARGLMLETYDVISANPPYYPTQQAQQFQHEPQIALDGGEDGLRVIHRIIQEAPKYLNTNGVLLLEIDKSQTHGVLNLFNAHSQWTVKKPIEITRGESVIIAASVGEFEVPKILQSSKKNATPLMEPAENWDRSLFRFLVFMLSERVSELDTALAATKGDPAKADIFARINAIRKKCLSRLSQTEPAGNVDVSANQFDIIQLHIETIFLIDLALTQSTRHARFYFNLNFLRKKENYFGPIAYYATIFILMDSLAAILVRNAEILLRFQRLPDGVKSLLRIEAIEDMRNKANAYIDIAKSFTVKRQNKFGERLSLTKQSNWYGIIYGLFFYCRELGLLTEAMQQIEIRPQP